MVKDNNPQQVFIAISVNVNVAVWVGLDCQSGPPSRKADWIDSSILQRAVPVQPDIDNGLLTVTHVEDMVMRITDKISSAMIDHL